MGGNMRIFNYLTGAVLALFLALPAAADSLFWEVRSEHPNVVSLEFYSQDRNYSWPGGGEVYILDDYDTHSYNLECRSGEKICLGAWVRGHSDEYWGVGRDDREGCTGCCYTCGGGDTGVQVLNE
jgi:hypothetical protein